LFSALPLVLSAFEFALSAFQLVSFSAFQLLLEVSAFCFLFSALPLVLSAFR
jgi:hypothetical protein